MIFPECRDPDGRIWSPSRFLAISATKGTPDRPPLQIPTIFSDPRLENRLDLRHELVGLVEIMDWQRFDEIVVERWVENSYDSSCCGEESFPHGPPIDPSSRTRFRHRIGASGSEETLKAMIDAGLESGTVKPWELRRLRKCLRHRQTMGPVIGHLQTGARPADEAQQQSR